MKQQTLATQAVRPAYEQLAGALPEPKHVSADETPTKVATMKLWQWTFVTDRFRGFAVRPSHRGEVAAELLTDEFCGVVGCDRAKTCWRFGRLPWCRTHLKCGFRVRLS
ncbi:MAG: transposase [Planctomycetaceae bacterium]|nr:transposase [Planctomycetaceae bacterium]